MQPLIFDRTREDEIFALENQDLPDLKGAYNASDLNRVGEWINYLSEKLGSSGYHVNATSKTNWTVSSIPSNVDFANYLNAIRAIRNWFLMEENLPGVLTNIRYITYSSANDIEYILNYADALIRRIQAVFIPLGEIQLGVGV